MRHGKLSGKHRPSPRASCSGGDRKASYRPPARSISAWEGSTSLVCVRPRARTIGAPAFTDIVPKVKLVYTDNFADAKGNVVPASHYAMQGDWPSEMLVTVTFEEDGSKTKMTLRHVGIPPEMINDCEAGWSGSFDKLLGIL